MKNSKKMHDSSKTKMVRTSGIVMRHKPSVGSKTATAGITLIALVVTIVVLLILAGITITFVLGENGIISMAKRAAEATNQAMQNEQEYLANVTEQLRNYLNGGSGGTTNPDNPPEPTTGPNGKPLAETITTPDNTKNIDAEDRYGNKITIPAGFTVVPHSGEKPADKAEAEWNAEKIEYNYREDHKPCVQDGIVIQDSEGNQFVWIPVGEIINNDGSKTTIDLARYTFNIGTYDSNTETYNGTGKIVTKVTDGSAIETYFLEELASLTTYENSKAKEIEIFKSNSEAKGGYYLARYEASKKIVNKADGETEEKVMSKANQDVWNNITEPNASSAAQAMYTNSSYTSDLINSYSWDTAIVFIQTYGGAENSAYSKQNSKNTSLAKTGISKDKVCNIYNMASNTAEWTTETYTSASRPCTARGGYYGVSKSYASARGAHSTTSSYDNVSFRPALYAK